MNEEEHYELVANANKHMCCLSAAIFYFGNMQYIAYSVAYQTLNKINKT